MALGYLALSKLAIGEERSSWALEHLALSILTLGSWHLGTEALGYLALGYMALAEERRPWERGHLARITMTKEME